MESFNSRAVSRVNRMRECARPDWLAIILHALIGLILGGIFGMKFSLLLDPHFSLRSIPAAAGFALLGAGAGAYIQSWIFTPFDLLGLLFFFMTKGKPELPPHSQASRRFAGILLGTGVAGILAGIVFC